jgi:hypothetical protein
MQKQYAGDALAFDTSLVGGPAGQGQVPADRALASVELPAVESAADVASVANLALTGGALVFESSWTSSAVDLGALDTGLSASDVTGPIVAEFASLLGSTDGGGDQSASTDIPIWGLTSDDLSFI